MASPRGCTGSARLNRHHQIAAAAIHAAERIPAQPAAIDLADLGAETGTAVQPSLLQQLPQDINLQGHGLHLTLKAAQVGAEVGDLQVAGKDAAPGARRSVLPEPTASAQRLEGHLDPLQSQHRRQPRPTSRKSP